MTGEIIGRDAELSVVQAFLDRPAEGLRALVLEGDAGIGKSKLWLAGVAAARERSFHVLASRPAEAERTLPYVVLGDLFADAEPEALAALPAPRRRAFESALLREEPDLPVDARALGVAIVTLLPMLANGRPLVLAIDDDQWLDPSSAATLRFAIRRSLRQPVLLLISRRLDGAPATALEEAIHPADVGRLRIGALSMGAIQLLLRSRLGITFPRPTLLRLHEASGGNPFYALELARARSVDPARDATVPWAVPPADSPGAPPHRRTWPHAGRALSRPGGRARGARSGACSERDQDRRRCRFLHAPIAGLRALPRDGQRGVSHRPSPAGGGARRSGASRPAPRARQAACEWCGQAPDTRKPNMA